MAEIQEVNDMKKPLEKVLATFEIEPKKLQRLKKLALEHERSYSFVLRKLVDQALEKGDFYLSATTNEVPRKSPR